VCLAVRGVGRGIGKCSGARRTIDTESIDFKILLHIKSNQIKKNIIPSTSIDTVGAS
jgi:hypothetical protein